MLKGIFLISILIVGILGASNYSFDGSGNNAQNNLLGKSETPMVRIIATAYDDEIGVPVGGFNPSKLPSARYISNMIFGRDASGIRATNPRLVTDILTFWGQFIDHDIDYAPATGNLGTTCDPFPIPVPKGDSFYDALGSGNANINYCRSIAYTQGTSKSDPRNFLNMMTSWIDGSNIYGTNQTIAAALRTFKKGLLKTSKGPDGSLLPLNDDGTGKVLLNMTNSANRVPSTSLFAAGDPRVNENPILLSLHTLFVREHNRRAGALPSTWNDEQRYQEARRWVIGHIQAITFNEYLPTLFGRKIPKYSYNNTLNPQVSVFFSSVAFRYFQDEISGIIPRYNKTGLPYKDGNILLRDSYFFPDTISKVGIDAYLRGAAVSQQNALDAQFDEDLRTFLYSQSPALASDLAAINIQRGRDNGISSYNDCRRAYGLTHCTTWSCVTNDTRVIALLDQVYGKDNVALLDAYLGGLLETKLPNSNLGELFTVSILEQFIRTRNSDKFWYQNNGVFTADQVNILDTEKLSDIIKRNCDIPVLPRDVFNRQNISPSVALGAASADDTKWLIAIIIPSVVAAVLVIVVIGMCFSNSKKGNVQDNRLYENLIEEK